MFNFETDSVGYGILLDDPDDLLTNSEREELIDASQAAIRLLTRDNTWPEGPGKYLYKFSIKILDDADVAGKFAYLTVEAPEDGRDHEFRTLLTSSSKLCLSFRSSWMTLMGVTPIVRVTPPEMVRLQPTQPKAVAVLKTPLDVEAERFGLHQRDDETVEQFRARINYVKG